MNEIEIARLDGYLNGIVSLNGQIRDYHAFAYLIKLDNGEKNPASALAKHYSQQTSVSFLSVDALKGGLGDIEEEIQSYFIRDLLNSGNTSFEEKVVRDRQKYLSFRVMDLIDGIIGDVEAPNVYRLIAEFDGVQNQSVFYCIVVANVSLVLQFNNDT